MSDFRLQPWPRAIAITTLLEFCSWLEIVKILELIIEPAYVLFQCDKIATKAIDLAVERISALKRLGFKYSEEKLIGHDGTEYDSYYVLEQ